MQYHTVKIQAKTTIKGIAKNPCANRALNQKEKTMTINIDFAAPLRARFINARQSGGNTYNETRSMSQKRVAARQYAADVRARRNGG